MDPFNGVYSATYSNVPVYEFVVNGNQVMRRRSDDWINATHILKVADFDKPARTRILEREVQKGVHEKVQGGYGKYQGTWVPLPDGRDLAKRNGILDKLMPILNFVPGDKSPPQAPKHTTAASNKPKVPKITAASRRAAAKALAAQNRISEEPSYDNVSVHMNDEDQTPDNTTVASYDDDTTDLLQMSQQSNGSHARKRKRGGSSHVNSGHHGASLSLFDEQHIAYGDELLDYFMLNQGGEDEHGGPKLRPPIPPEHFVVNRPIDEQGHTALHWAVAMGDVNVARDLVDRGANINSASFNGETPLMRAVLFTNACELGTFPKLVYLLEDSISATDNFGSTVFHHLSATTGMARYSESSRYYCEHIVQRLSEIMSGDEVIRYIDTQDGRGDTALTIAAGFGARKLVRSLIGHGASSQIRNRSGETADQLLARLYDRQHPQEVNPMASSSPFQPDAYQSRDLVPGQGAAGATRTAASTALTNHTQPTHYSEAARSIATKFTPHLLEQSKKLADAFDAELQEKEADLKEARRLLSGMNSELEAVQQQRQDLEANEPGKDDDEREEAELAALERESLHVLEHAQRRELQELVDIEEAKIGKSSSSPSKPAAGGKSDDSSSEEGLQKKFQVLVKLQHEQAMRKKLVQEIVTHSANAGTGERIPQYRSLISKALGMDEDKIEEALPGILEELELNRKSDVAVLRGVEGGGGAEADMMVLDG